jgi:hypothetical protein
MLVYSLIGLCLVLIAVIVGLILTLRAVVMQLMDLFTNFWPH